MGSGYSQWNIQWQSLRFTTSTVTSVHFGHHDVWRLLYHRIGPQKHHTGCTIHTARSQTTQGKWTRRWHFVVVAVNSFYTWLLSSFVEVCGSSPEVHFARTREWPNPNPKPNHNPNTLTLTLKTILVRCASGLDPRYACCMSACFSGKHSDSCGYVFEWLICHGAILPQK